MFHDVNLRLSKLYAKADEISYQMIEAQGLDLHSLEEELEGVEHKISQLEYERDSMSDVMESINDYNDLREEA